MAKQKTTNTKIAHIHVPTKIGLTVIGIAVLVYVLFITTIFNTNGQMQTIYSQAATQRIPLIHPKKPIPTAVPKKPKPTAVPKKKPAPTAAPK